MEDQRTEMRGMVVLVPWPFQGHINPILQLGTALHSKGFSITIAHTEFNSPNPSNHQEFNFLPVPDGLTDSDLSLDLIALVQTVNAKFEAPLEECLTKMVDQEKASHDRLVYIIYDGVVYAGANVAKHLQVPSFIFHTNSPSSMLACSLISQLREEGYLPLQESMLQELVPGLDSLRFKDLPLSPFGTLESLIQIIAIVIDTRTSSAIIWNTVKEFEHSSLERLQQQFQIPFFSIGPLFKFSQSSSSSSSLIEEDTECIEWLNKQAPNSVLYVSLGSVVRVDDKTFAEMAWGLAYSGQPFLWVTRPGLVLGSQDIELPQGFEDEIQGRGYIVKWAPQKKVLAHKAIGGFWSHCGWNSTIETIAEGVPMICSPSFGDQKVNAAYVSNIWKVGVEMDEKLERGKIMEVVRRLMTNEEGEEIRKRANNLKEKVEICVSKGGSSYDSLNEFAELISSL